MHEVQVVAAALQVLQGEVQAEQAPPERKYPLLQTEQADALVHD